MRIPNTINRNCLKAFEKDPSCLNWDEKNPKSLRELCLECIALHWIEHPILNEIVHPEDKILLLDILPVDLPLHLTIPLISEESFWIKSFLAKWPKSFHERSRRISRSWKNIFIEMHVKTYLESLKPEDYNPEHIKELCDLCGSYVKVLDIQEMISSETSSNKIPLNSVLMGLSQLTELSLCFKQRHVEESFTWNVVTTSYEDINLLARGLKCVRLKTLRITNSDINCNKAITILKAVLRHEIDVLDLSNCKIGDKGAMAVAQFALQTPVKKLYLANNKIGSQGVEGLAYAVTQKSCTVCVMDIHLNQFSDEVADVLVRYGTLKELLISGCGLSSNFNLAEALKYNHHLEFLDISNNNLEVHVGNNIFRYLTTIQTVGFELLRSLKNNSILKKIDIRMCKIPSSYEIEIQEEVRKSSKGLKKLTPLVTTTIPPYWDENLLVEMSNILNNATD